MTIKPSLSFYTNMPTPYQLAFFKELSKLFQLTVIYYSHTQSDRSWQFDLSEDYTTLVLRNNFIAKAVQKKVLDFHFSWQIFKTVSQDTSQYVIVGGSYWIPDGAFALLGARMKGRKVAYFSEALFEVNGKLKYAIKRTTLRILNLCCDAIFCIGSKAVRSFENYGVTVPKFIIPYNIDAAGFAAAKPEGVAYLRSRYKPNGEVVFLSSGSLIERKGMDVLIRATKDIGLPNVRLVIIGDGPERSKLETIIGDDARIALAGFQQPDDIPLFFAMADVFVFASRYDGWAVVINEAVAAGLPIISSRHVAAAVELITSPEFGILCDSDDVACFKNAMEELATDEVRREAIRQRMPALAPFISSDHNAQRVFDIFVNELKGKGER